MNKPLLNCDIGESFGAWEMGQDESVMPYIDCANIACGFHASDPRTMSRTVALALAHEVHVGAHPSYPDLVGFGRRSMACAPEEVVEMLLYQIGALTPASIARLAQAQPGDRLRFIPTLQEMAEAEHLALLDRLERLSRENAYGGADWSRPRWIAPWH